MINKGIIPISKKVHVFLRHPVQDINVQQSKFYEPGKPSLVFLHNKHKTTSIWYQWIHSLFILTKAPHAGANNRLYLHLENSTSKSKTQVYVVKSGLESAAIIHQC